MASTDSLRFWQPLSPKPILTERHSLTGAESGTVTDSGLLDLNEENITAHDSLGNTTVFDIGRIRKVREKYVYKTSRFKRNDVHKRKKVTKKYGAKQKNLTDDVLHKAGPIHHTIRLWGHNGGSYRNTKDVQKGKRPRIQIPGANECVAVLPTAKIHRVQGRMGGGDSR